MHDGLPEPEPLLSLVDSLKRLPGVGVRTARRMAYHLLQNDLAGAKQLAQSLNDAVENLRHCRLCNSFTQDEVCATCQNPKRDNTLLCIVETPSDQNMIESSHSYNGLYYVLMGKLTPLEGVGPDQLGFAQVLDRACDGVVKEVVVATNFTAEGETTAYYLTELLKSQGLKVSRIARGIPAGSELEYVDAGTIAWALHERKSSE